MSKTEIRSVASKLEFRESTAPNSIGELLGIAAVFNSLSLDLGKFKERILPGAFTKALRDGAPDCVCLQDHNSSLLLGRVRAGSLFLEQKPTGLWYRCLLPNTSTARDVRELALRGDIYQNSFSFSLDDGDDEWADGLDDEGNKCTIRTIRSIPRLYDVSPVCSAAYPQTSLTAREARSADYSMRAAKRGILSPAEIAENQKCILRDRAIRISIAMDEN